MQAPLWFRDMGVCVHMVVLVCALESARVCLCVPLDVPCACVYVCEWARVAAPASACACRAHARVCARVRVCACGRAYERACERACAHACERACVCLRVRARACALMRARVCVRDGAHSQQTGTLYHTAIAYSAFQRLAGHRNIKTKKGKFLFLCTGW